MLTWLVEKLGEKWPKITRLDILEKTHEIQRRLLSSEEVLELMTKDEVEEIILKLREIRCLRKNKLLEYQYELNDICGKTVLTSVANVMFDIELLLTFKIRLDKWNESVENGSLETWGKMVDRTKLKYLETNPEAQVVRIPLSQLVENLKLLTMENTCSKFTVEELDKLVYGLHERATIFTNTELPEEDMDIEDYRIPVPTDEAQCRE